MLMRITSGFHLLSSSLEAASRSQDKAHKTLEQQEWSVHLQKSIATQKLSSDNN
jgi:hypothetical protein